MVWGLQSSDLHPGWMAIPSFRNRPTTIGVNKPDHEVTAPAGQRTSMIRSLNPATVIILE